MGTVVVTMTTTTVAVAGTAVTVAAQVVTSDNGLIAASASVRTRNSRRAISAQVAKEVVCIRHGLATVDAMTRTTTARAIGIKATAAEKVATSVSTSTVKSANAWTQARRRPDVQRAVSAVPRVSSATSDVTMKTITAAATGTVATVVEKVATQGSSRIVRNANVWIQRRGPARKSAAANAKALASRVTNAATMEITTVDVTGTMVTAADQVATSTNILIAKNAYAKIPRNRKSVRRKEENVAPPRTWAMDVATMKTTTVPVVGTMETAAGRVTINTNSRIVKGKLVASVWTRLRVANRGKPPN